MEWLLSDRVGSLSVTAKWARLQSSEVPFRLTPKSLGASLSFLGQWIFWALGWWESYPNIFESGVRYVPGYQELLKLRNWDMTVRCMVLSCIHYWWTVFVWSKKHLNSWRWGRPEGDSSVSCVLHRTLCLWVIPEFCSCTQLRDIHYTPQTFSFSLLLTHSERRCQNLQGSEP